MSKEKQQPNAENPEEFLDLKLTKRKTVAAGIPAVLSSGKHVFSEMNLARGLKALAELNQKDGFDCPGCAWPDPDGHRSPIAEYCENGAKAVAEEATTKKLTAKFFAENSVMALAGLNDYEIGKKGRVAEPVYLPEGGTHYQPISWENAFNKIAQHLNKLATPDEAIFYTSGRTINYLRLAVTDRCNLRCFYCMPEEGINWLERKELMTNDELLRLSAIAVNMGITKIRITGGEPFVRKDIMPFLGKLSRLQGLNELTITTNGVLTAPLVPELKKLGIHSVNLSLDTLDRNRFFTITHRDEMPAVMATMDALLTHGIEVKINAVVMQGKNTEDIIPLVALTKELPVSVRFIEEMPFNGGGHYSPLLWDHVKILNTISEHFTEIKKIPDARYSTSYNYHIPGHKGTVGIIAAYTRSFCGTCNRLRITPQGMLKTCLYDDGVLNIKELMRSRQSDEALKSILISAIGKRAKDGWEAEQSRHNTSTIHESMAAIGG